MRRWKRCDLRSQLWELKSQLKNQIWLIIKSVSRCSHNCEMDSHNYRKLMCKVKITKNKVITVKSNVVFVRCKVKLREILVWAIKCKL